MSRYVKYAPKMTDRTATFEFFESDTLPANIPISTPFTFPFIGDEVVLSLDKNGWWNPLGGHMEIGETYLDTLVREAQEEAGVVISKASIQIVGYILNTNFPQTTDQKYPNVNILPITGSFVEQVNSNWTPRETSSRKLLSRKRALRRMESREDKNQMGEILNYIYNRFESQNYEVNFTYHQNKLFKNVPITQVFTFCKNETNKYCIVQDYDESFYSLPGGGCDLGEAPEECIARELEEEEQITCDNIHLLGSILVELKKDNQVVSRFQHLRYTADLKNVVPFEPRKNGQETILRHFVPLSELRDKVRILQNPTADQIIQQVNTLS